MAITNLERLNMEIEGINISDYKLTIYLEESGLDYLASYDTKSNTNKKKILKTALSILESIANNPQTMKNYKDDDITISNFHENLQNRIDVLEKKIRQIPNDDIVNTGIDSGSSFIYMFSN